MSATPTTSVIELTIDGRAVGASEGENLMRVAARHGIAIPHFCHHPRLSVAGNCRMCLVKIDGAPKLMPACNLSVAANMKISTDCPEVQRARASVLQFLMLNHPVDCGVCDKSGECHLQDLTFAFGTPRSQSSEPKRRKRKLHPLTERLLLDDERCILCSRCVRFTQEISRSNLLGIVDRGGHAHVERAASITTDDPYSGNVVDLCPTGALLSRDFLYAGRVWFLEPVQSVCTGCARGCSIDVWRRKKEWRTRTLDGDANARVYRVTARDNPEINGPWICNKGYDQPRLMARERPCGPLLAGEPVTLEAALRKARELLASARSPAALVSSWASNEEIDAFAATLGARMTIYAKQDRRALAGEVLEDGLLIRADKNPNSQGVRQRLGSHAFDASAGRHHDLFFVWGEWPDRPALGGATLIQLTAFADPNCADAAVCIPLSTSFERGGTFTNFAGKLNRFEPVFDKPDWALHAVDVFARLAR